MIIFAIDPGYEQSGWVLFDAHATTIESGVQSNDDLLAAIEDCSILHLRRAECYIEDIACFGMPVGREVFTTAKWIGRFIEAWRGIDGQIPYQIERRLVKLHHCYSARAKDSNIRQALYDRFGQPGTKNAPGKLYGLKSHALQAFALAVYAADTANARRQGAA